MRCPTCRQVIENENDLRNINRYGECLRCSLNREQDKENFNDFMSQD